jgi:hypothetical protein
VRRSSGDNKMTIKNCVEDNIIQFTKQSESHEKAQAPSNPADMLEALSCVAKDTKTLFDPGTRSAFLEMLPDYLNKIAGEVYFLKSRLDTALLIKKTSVGGKSKIHKKDKPLIRPLAEIIDFAGTLKETVNQ